MRKKDGNKKSNLTETVNELFKEEKSKKTTKVKKVKNENDEVVEKVREVVVERNSGFNTIEVLVIILVTILFGIAAGYALSYSRTGGVEVSKETQELIQTYNNILVNYDGEVSEEELLDAAVSGMVSSLGDPHSTFLEGTESDNFNQTISGSFVGIGVTVQWCENKFYVVEVLDNTPASGKIIVGDIITSVDGKSTDGITINELVDMITGKVGTKVKVEVLRDEETKTYTFKRKKVELDSVYSRMVDDKIGYILIESFAGNTFEQFEKQLKTLEKDGMESLIIDVRNNAGGRLSEASDILDLFLKKNKVLYIVQTKDETEMIYSKNDTYRSYPVAVLVDKGSASASEILAAGFKDNYKNIHIVGTTTYGKGTVQKAVSLSSGATLKYTTQKWLTPKGEWLNGKGLKPDVEVEQSKEYYSDPTDEKDTQLQDAIKVLKEKRA